MSDGGPDVQDADPGNRGQPSSQSHGDNVGEDELAQRLSSLARTLQQENDTDRMLEEVVRAAVQLIPGAEEGSISVVTRRESVSSKVPSSDLPQQVDAVQSEVGEGPCLDAVYEQETVRVPDMASEQRWPRFARRAHELGAGSMLSFQLYVEEDNLGALNLYARTPHAFDDESEHIGLLFASHAAVAFAGAQKVDQLRAGMATRDVIGQAKGILMERYKLTGDRAFAVLVRYSQDTNRKLRDVATELVMGGELTDSSG